MYRTQFFVIMTTLYWKIKNVLVRAYGKEIIESPILSMNKSFENEFSDIERFLIQVYSKGSDRDSTRYLTVFLSNKSDFELEIRYTLFIIKKDGSKYMICKDKSRFAPKNRGWEYKTSIKFAELEHENFLQRGDLVIGATISHGKGHNKQGHCNQARKSIEAFADRFVHTFNFDLNAPKDNMESLSDLEIKCGEYKRSFFCHKIMLAMSSSVFKAGFENSSSSDGKKEIIKITEDPETVATLINFVYTGKVEKNKINHKLLLASDKYDMKLLLKCCEEALGQQFKQFEHIGELVQAAITTHELGSKEYQDIMVTSLAANWIKVKESNYYQDIKADSELLSKIILHLTGATISYERENNKKSYCNQDTKSIEAFADCFVHSFNFDLNTRKDNMEALSDLEIKCGEDENSFMCHKVMLAMSSSVFKKMIENSNSSDGNKDIIKLPEDPDTVAALLNFVYTGHVEKTKINHKLFLASDKYDMTYLQECCEDALCQQFEQFENIGVLVPVAVTTHELGSKKYQDTMVASIANNWIKVRESKYYQDIKKDSELLSKIILHNTNLMNFYIETN